MSRVLIWKQTAPGCEYDIFTPTDYDALYDHVQSSWGGVCKNWGNRVWFQGIYSALDTGENEYDFITDQIDIDRINSTYDLIVLPMANIFYQGFLEPMRYLTSVFEKIRIPVYVVVCGVQADSYDSLNEIIAAIGGDSARFIRAIYQTGGEFALRGYFTKEFFERLGFSSAVVTGCPSLYQMGPDFTVETRKMDARLLKPVFNGHIPPMAALMQSYPESVFLDQDEFFRPLLQPDYLKEPTLRFRLDFLNQFGMEAAQMLAQGRILMIADTNDWWNYLRDAGANYAFGSRIHGTIMALLSGVPATIVTYDSRTREMAEYFDIPRLQADRSHCFRKEELLEAYAGMDYAVFNRKFRQRFETYERFLTGHGIVSTVNTDNKFFVPGGSRAFEVAQQRNQADMEVFYAELRKHGRRLSAMNQIRRITKRVF